MASPNLTPTSYIVLGLLDICGEATPYELKQLVAATLGSFWSVQHAQLYSEPERLASAGLVSERREEAGRRRRHYSNTDAGREALAAWRAVPPDRSYELRDLGLLKLFFGSDPATVAEAQLKIHRDKLEYFESLRAQGDVEGPRGAWMSLAAGIRHERTAIEFWEDVRAGRDPFAD